MAWTCAGGASAGSAGGADLSALEVRKPPKEGQVVRATYQVENTTENVVVSLAGEVLPGH